VVVVAGRGGHHLLRLRALSDTLIFCCCSMTVLVLGFISVRFFYNLSFSTYILVRIIFFFIINQLKQYFGSACAA